MKLVIFGLSVSSSWGNGHATLWRGLCRALAGMGHRVVFFERDVPYYSAHRDLTEIPGVDLCLYSDWAGVLGRARRVLSDADAGIVTSYCPDSLEATSLLLLSPARLRIFYDLDTPITLNRLKSGEPVPYIGPNGLRDFDLVLSYTGGHALAGLQSSLGARRVVPLYGSVDPGVHSPAATSGPIADLSYLGTYAEDRQAALETFFVEPARRLPGKHFVIGGALYPKTFPWTENIFFARHVPPPEHAAFYCSSRLTLNVTRNAMAKMGFCPSGRLFEAAACGVPILTDSWEGLDSFFKSGSEILIAHNTEQAIDAILLPDADLARVAHAARERVLECHTARRRAQELEAILESALSAPAQVNEGMEESRKCGA